MLDKDKLLHIGVHQDDVNMILQLIKKMDSNDMNLNSSILEALKSVNLEKY